MTSSLVDNTTLTDRRRSKTAGRDPFDVEFDSFFDFDTGFSKMHEVMNDQFSRMSRMFDEITPLRIKDSSPTTRVASPTTRVASPTTSVTTSNAGSNLDPTTGRFTGENTVSISTVSNTGQQNLIPIVSSKGFVEEGNNYSLKLDVPASALDAIKISEKNGFINVSAKIETIIDDSKENYVSKSRSLRSFRNSFKLPENADRNSVVAKHENGVLNITVQKV